MTIKSQNRHEFWIGGSEMRRGFVTIVLALSVGVISLTGCGTHGIITDSTLIKAEGAIINESSKSAKTQKTKNNIKKVKKIINSIESGVPDGEYIQYCKDKIKEVKKSKAFKSLSNSKRLVLLTRLADRMHECGYIYALDTDSVDNYILFKYMNGTTGSIKLR